MATAATLRPTLRLDLSTLSHPHSHPHPRRTPFPPSNTLLITHLHHPEIFEPSNLTLIQQTISTYAPIHTFTPMRSFRRIIVTFARVAEAQNVRAKLDGHLICGVRARVGFGRAMRVYASRADGERLLRAASATTTREGAKRSGLLRTARDEEDRANALDGLRHRRCLSLPKQDGVADAAPSSPVKVLYESHSPHLPAIAVEDTTTREGQMDLGL